MESDCRLGDLVKSPLGSLTQTQNGENESLRCQEEKKRVEQEARIARGEPEPAEEPKPSPEEVLENKLEQIEKETNKENNTALVNNKEERAGATVEEVVEEVKKIQ